ncbi:MAG: hypothetical protein AB1714_06610 [Acidobacteriota bacterium]
MRTIRCLSGMLLWSVLLAGCHNWPASREGDESKSQRGRRPDDHTADNLNVPGPEGTYPPRAQGLASQSRPFSDSWLLDAESDWDRFRRLEVMLRGVDIHMLEIGFRFDRLHDAIERGEMELAQYEMEKIVQAASFAILLQPGWQEGKGIEYLGRSDWMALKAAVLARNQEAAKTSYLDVRQACMSCHTLKQMEFLNRQQLFARTASFTQPDEQGGDR